jgi:hypothetical protein
LIGEQANAQMASVARGGFDKGVEVESFKEVNAGDGRAWGRAYGVQVQFWRYGRNTGILRFAQNDNGLRRSGSGGMLFEA